MTSTGLGKMHLDLYTQNAGLTQKAKFWCNFVSSLKDRPDGLLAKDDPMPREKLPSIWDVKRPVDITLYDLIYPVYPFAPGSGNQDLRAPDELSLRVNHPSIVNTLPDDFPDLKHEFSKLESQMFDKPRKRASEPLTPVLPDAHDRIFTPGYAYNPVHTEIYGTYRSRTARRI